jgi:hypothetical protein
MAQLILDNIDPEIVEKLQVRAKRLGTTPEEEASRLLQDQLRAEPGAIAGADPRFEKRGGFLVFTGAIGADDIPDHRALREERVDSLLKGAGEGRL